MLKTNLPDTMAAELGTRARRYRIDYPMTQKELSEKSGVSVGSIQRFENNGGILLTNLIRILQALNLDQNLDLLIPDQTERPSYQLALEKNEVRARATSPSKRQHKKNGSWKWGDES